MFEKQRFLILIVLTFLLSGIALLLPKNNLTSAAAQSTSDTLPTRTHTPTFTPRPSATPSPTNTTVAKVWQARLVSNTMGVTEGKGSIFRVSIQGLKDIPIQVRSPDQLLIANSGSNPEYGPYSAEFAPVPKGVWTVAVPSLGVSLEVVADNYNLAIIEFVQVPETTPITRPNATATSLQAARWQGRLISETAGKGVHFSRLLIQVVGRDGQPVQLATQSQVINMAHTGQKPRELGPNMVEFTGLTPGKYIITPLGLGVSFEVELKPNIETRVEFQAVSPTATALPTSTPTPTRYIPPGPTFTPFPLTDTPTPIPTLTPTLTPSHTPPAPTFTPTPLFTPTPVTRWLGRIESRTPINTSSTITIRVTGIEGLPIRVVSTFSGDERRCITGQVGLAQDECVFANLEPGQYTIAPEGLDVKLPTTLIKNESVRVNFDIEVLPPGITGWQARLNSNNNGFHAMPQFAATIRVRLIGTTGQVVALRSARTPNSAKYCEVVYNPVLGDLICEFGQLGPGVYTVEALNTGAYMSLFIDGIGDAEVEFLPGATYTTLLAAQTSPQAGHGARPNPPSATPSATPIRSTIVQPTPTQTLTPTPTPAFAWQGRVLESNYTGAGAIGVRAAGLNDHPVILRSGGWQSPIQMTGTKEELGLYATEFGGLAPGEYIVELLDLAELKVTLQAGEFMLVEFRYDIDK